MNILESFSQGTTASYFAIDDVLMVLILGTILGTSISLVYQKTSHGTSYSVAFVSSLILLCNITAIVMLIIGTDLARAFGLVGALSIIRFRTAIKDPKDITFIFLALVIGIAVGTQNYHIAIIGTFFLLILIYLLDQFNYRSFTNTKYYLSVEADRNDFQEGNAKPILDKLTKSFTLNSVNTMYNSEDMLKVIYKLSIAPKKESEIVTSIKRVKGVKDVSLIAFDNYVGH